MIHETAAAGFAAGSEAYERGRPSYPDAAVAHVVAELGVDATSTVVDVGAGTGKLTRLLVPTGARLVAVEPVAAMRSALAELVPSAEVLDGTGEALPLDDASADAVTVAQAFHWFDAPAALAEIARVLRPGGGLALLWNSRDHSVEWVARLSEIIRWNRGQIPAYDDGKEDWAAVVARDGRFSPLQRTTFSYEQELDEQGLVDRVASTSYIAAMTGTERERVLADVRALVAGFPERFVLPYRTDVYWCRRR